MKIDIRGKEYEFELTGTVGIIYEFVKNEGYEPEMSKVVDRLGVYYYAFRLYNDKEKELPDMAQFIASMTSKKMNDIDAFFWKRWNELEGKETEEKPSDSKNDLPPESSTK